MLSRRECRPDRAAAGRVQWLAYGHRLPAPLVSYGVQSTLPLRIATLVAPVHRFEQEPDVSAVLKPNGEPVGLAFVTGEQLIFGDGGLPSLSDHGRHHLYRRG